MTNEITQIQSLLASVWPEWKIVRRLGRGTYGAVYEIIRDDLGSTYKSALKVLHMEADESDNADLTVQIMNPGQRSLDPHSSGSVRDPAREQSPGLYPDSADPLVRNIFTDTPARADTGGLLYQSHHGILEEFVRNVSHEIDLMVQLKGTPNIVSIDDFAVIRHRNARTILIRMEKLEGLDRMAEADRGMDRKDVIRIGMDICSALIRCETKKIIHRDIKPGNIFYSENAGYKLGDFGISRTMDSLHEKMSMSGVGTIQYMAPEVYYGGRYDNTVDIYSLGLTLYTLLNDNVPPFCGLTSLRSDGSLATADRHEANMRRLKGEPLPPPAHADSRLARVILKACDSNSLKRYQSASDFRRDLEECLKPEQVRDSVPPRRVMTPVTLFLIVDVLLLAIAALLFFHPWSEDKKQLAYTVIYQDSEGNVLEKRKLEGFSGETVTFTASPIDGYSIEENEKSLTLSDDTSENRLVFVYVKEIEAEEIPEPGAGAEAEPEPEAEAETEPEPEAISWTDPDLEAAVRNSTGLSGEITFDLAQKVSSLTLDSSGISDLNDLRYFTGLKKLSLADNFVTDVSPLAGLTRLTDLNLEKNQVRDVSPLENLLSLERLDLYQNRVSDISALSEMTNLRILDLRENDVSDLKALTGMVYMEELYLSNNRNISDIRPLSNMSVLNYLSVKSTKVKNISVVANMIPMNTLVISHTGVSDLTPLKGLKNLGYIDVNGCPLNDASIVLLDKLKKNDDNLKVAK